MRHKARLTALHEICLHIFRHIASKFLARQNLPAKFLDNLPKNLPTHLPYKLYAALPIVYPESAEICSCI